MLGVELQAAMLEVVTESNRESSEDNEVKKCTSKNYVIHHLLLHGAASNLPSALSLAVQASAEISIHLPHALLPHSPSC